MHNAFNLKASKDSHPLDALSKLVGDEKLRSGDLDGIDPSIILEMLQGKFPKKTANYNPFLSKQAVHGYGFDREVPGTTGLTNLPMPDDRFRQLPGGGLNNTNDEKEDMASRGRPNDYMATVRWNKLFEGQDAAKGKLTNFVVRKYPGSGEAPTKELAIKMFGPKGQCDGHSVFVIVPGKDNAMRTQKLRGGIIEIAK